MRMFTEQDVRELLAPEDAIASLEAAFLRDWQAKVSMPNRLHMQLPTGGSFLVMPCSDHELPAVGMKVVTVRKTVLAGESRIYAVFFLYSDATGELQAVFEANRLTAVRTAAVSALATRVLARTDAHVLGIFGTGVQAWSHVELLRLVRDFKQVLICGSTTAKSRQFAQRAAPFYGVDVVPADPATCAAESDVLCTCTTSIAPLFDGRLLRSGTHLNLIGAFRPDTREVDEYAIRRARIVVDTYDGALAEAGDVIIPLNMGLIKTEDVADLHDVISGRKSSRTSQEQITAFKSVGCAYEDLVIAKLIYEAALTSKYVG
jgi:ornithine cyclodeaminase/alanine dehydrogenase-like protein (mu-crystallin family)